MNPALAEGTLYSASAAREFGPPPRSWMRRHDTAIIAVVLTGLISAGAGCGGSAGRPRPDAAAARIGVDGVPAVHLVENHSAALTLWRRAGVTGRIVLHVDGHADFDWLPEETVARIAAASGPELQALELHPYAMDGMTLRKFGIWNFIYPAARLGIVREVVWVVPDGTLSDPESLARLRADVLLGKLHGVSIEEAELIRADAKSVHATLLGVPMTICELASVPAFTEPVLLDLDLDYFTTRSAVSQEVAASPWIAPDDVVAALSSRGIRTDFVTISLSTIGGFFPPANRWIGPSLQKALRDPAAAVSSRERLAASERAGSTANRGAVAIWREVVDRRPDDASAWYELSRALGGEARGEHAREALARAVGQDPLLAHAELFEADRLWINEEFEAALERYRAYSNGRKDSPFAAYALRREAGCLMRLQRDREAIEAFERVVAVAPEHGDTRLDLGVLLREAGRPEAALDQLRAARAILPDLGTYALALGTTLYRMGRLPEALAELEEAVARRPTWIQARMTLAAVLADSGRADEASRHARVARFLDPSSRQAMQLEAAIRRRFGGDAGLRGF